MESGKRYTQKVEKSFHISKACLEPVSSGNKPISVYVETDNKKFLICVLQKTVTLQSSLDLNFMLGEKVAFFIVGKGTVHVTGYLHDTEEDLDNAVFSEEEIIEEAKKEKSKKRKDQPQPTKQNVKKLKIEDSDNDEDDSDVDLSDLVGEEEEDDDEDEEMDKDEVEEDEDDDDEDESNEVPQLVESLPQKKSKKQKKKEKEQQNLAQGQSSAQDGKVKKAAGGVTPKPQTPQVNETPNTQQSGKKDKKKKGGVN